MENKQSLIADARREQIIKAAIEVLTEIGYLSTSLSKIANKANISTGLISYHFSGKEDLMKNTLMYLVEQERAFIKGKVEQKQTYMEKLMVFIEASLAYQGTNRGYNTALLEIVFNARTPDNVPYYLAEINDEDQLNVLLKEILYKGQESKEFGDFDPQVIAIVIRGALSASMSLPQNELSLEDYSEKIIKSFLKMIK
ncbi:MULTISPECIES: TetR/AcrR family transcriptional regulator [unclassified Paenibacillus]|uniref:TetR/AcrR family transcriptional regulator n=1 Tax=Paenibacillus provencensis TaxID=441151 RepID=A0ABW3PNY2_9BACL|nr:MULTISPECIES: TetR/AcrR family transcriptional regulator [unclassified Paenibacillus]MCM3129712.1 TetR family transcriptional regulator [Paenibacillus sp. MER 78]SFS54922.1 DNA-binding transcriptional regulator, AcrR family [Paenibacillus sp. 453mf]